EKIEPPARPQEEAIISEPVKMTTEELLEQQLPGEMAVKEETASALPEQDGEATDVGEVELIIGAPADPKMVSKLYGHLQARPEIKILRTRGSWGRGTAITLVLEKSVPLMSVISNVSGVEVTLESPEEGSSGEEKPDSGPRTRKKGARIIRLALKEAQTP
ncbi:hypothetical protein ACFLVX_05375, partial [Chloroflexota bacterium]